MRYLIHKSQHAELSARQEYLYSALKMYFLPGTPEGNYIPLTPVGCSGPDVLFITGHTNEVQSYLNENLRHIPEKTVVITSCCGQTFKKFASNKSIYVPSLKEFICVLRYGKHFGFDFNISDAELDFHNAKGSIMEKIKKAYERL